MAARRGKSQAKRGGSGRSLPAWIWLLAGLLLGLGLSGFLLLREQREAARAPTPNPTARAARESEPPVAQRAEPAPEAKPKYDFYTVLAEREVQIPDSELAAQAQREANAAAAAAAAPSATDRYLLQAGAFADARDAEAVKARLALLGLVARVETGAVDGKPVHRVRLGPYASARELEGAKRQLADNGIRDAIAIRADR
jgi:cell division protein FtsN